MTETHKLIPIEEYKELMVAKELRSVLTTIAEWELPNTGKFYPNADGSVSDRPVPYDSAFAYGSDGGKEYIREVARKALSNFGEVDE